MRQTVVGVFETSEEARRAQAALLDAQFRPASIRVSAGGTPTGADDGMAYPSSAGFGGDFLSGPPASPAPGATSATAHRATTEEEGPLERVSAFFRDLFSPEDPNLEMARYEEAVRRGGTLVAVDTEDELEETLASDMLIRAGAYDLEERARSWGRPDYAAEEGMTAGLEAFPGSVEAWPDTSRPAMARQAGARPAVPRPATLPDNVTSMDPADPTGYVASRSDTMGSGMPSGTVARTRGDEDAVPAGPVDTRPFGEGLAGARRSYDESRGPLDARRGDEEWGEDDGLESDRLEVFSTDRAPTEADRLESDLTEARTMSMDRQDSHAVGGSMQPRSLDKDRSQAMCDIDRMSPHLTEADRAESEQLEAARLEADRIEADRQEAARLDAAHRETRSAEAAHRVAERRQAERVQAQRSRTPTGGSSTLNPPNPGEAVVSGREADHLLRSGEEVFVDDAGFASSREEATRAAASQKQDRSPISRQVRIYSRRADDPAAIRAADADSATDMRAELGLRSPLDDQRTSRRRVLDDGAPFASDPYDDDGRRYAQGTEDEDGTESGFVDVRDPHAFSDPMVRSGTTSSAWCVMRGIA